MGKNHWRDGEKPSSQDVQQWRRERAKGSKRVREPLGKKAPLNRFPEKPTVGGRFAQGRYYRQRRRYCHPTCFSPPTALKRTRSSGTAARGGGTTVGVKQRASTTAVLAALLAALPPGRCSVSLSGSTAASGGSIAAGDFEPSTGMCSTVSSAASAAAF